MNREKQVLKFIENFMIKNGYTPTIREIGEGVGLKSTSSVHTYFNRLVQQGLIKQMDKRASRYSVKGIKYVRM